MYLTPLKLDDLKFTDDMDRIFTKLSLTDYRWVNYELDVRFVTKRDEQYRVTFEYFGAAVCDMVVRVSGKVIIYRFKSEIFKAYIGQYLKLFIKYLDETRAFCAGEFVLGFYNHVLENGWTEDE